MNKLFLDKTQSLLRSISRFGDSAVEQKSQSPEAETLRRMRIIMSKHIEIAGLVSSPAMTASE